MALIQPSLTQNTGNFEYQVNLISFNTQVNLISVNATRLRVIQAIMVLTGLRLKKSEELVESAPVLFDVIEPDKLLEIEKILTDKGAKFEIINLRELTPSELQNLLAEASNENTLPERLKEIHRYSYLNGDIGKTLASNPNTPLEVLIILARKFPAQFLENPVLDSYLLSNPNLLGEIPFQTFVSILELPQAPQEFISFALNHYGHYGRKDMLVFILSHHVNSWNEWRKDKIKIGDSATFLTFYPHANLKGTYLKGANLSRCYLSNANLSNANLSHTYLGFANLSNANLSSANLSHTCLSGTNLSGANLKNANLKNGDLRGANLEGANLIDTNLDKIKTDDNTHIKL